MKNRVVINKNKRIIIFVLSSIIVGLCIHCFITVKHAILDYKVYKESVETREDMFQMLLDNQTEYEELVINLKSKFGELDKRVLNIRNKEDYELYGIDESLAKKYPIYWFGISSIRDVGGVEVRFHFKYPPKPYSYWGIEYRENGEPPTWGVEKPLDEKDGIYTDIGSFYKFETEKITDNWYYFQCRIR